MFWPLVLPAQITLVVLSALVAAWTVAAPRWKWKRSKAFLLGTLLVLPAFVPSCAGVALVVDAVRFGTFHYASYQDVPEERWRRYMPPAAVNIQIDKGANGYLARYEVAAAEFHEYVDDLRDRLADHPEFFHDKDSREGEPMPAAALRQRFSAVGGPYPDNAVTYGGPRELDGGGAVYYYDADAGVAYQSMAIW